MAVPRRGWRLLALLTLALGAAVFIARGPILRGLGWALVSVDPIQHADVIVVAIGAGGAGVLEAADLVKDGVAPRVSVFADPLERPDREFIKRGIPYQDNGELSIRQLKALGVARAELMPRTVEGTEDEARALAVWCAAQRVRSIVVVGTSDHTRRLRRVLRRSLGDADTTITIRASRYSEFDPDRWWTTRDGARTGIVELQKLLLDLVRHPLS
jgi:uncharacterized SAM-binding protein YcdF (DUF218 family)